MTDHTNTNTNNETNAYSQQDAGSEETTLNVYHQIELQADDLDEYNELGLPHVHPHLFAKSLQAQLARLPLLELDSQQDLFSEHTVALSA